MSDLLKPPAIAWAILSFFSNQPDFAALAGDMGEEFQQRARISGASAAKLWYWRETVRNAWALTAREMWRTPARSAMVAVGCLMAVNIATGAYVVSRTYPHPFEYSKAMKMLLDWRERDIILILQFIASFATGCVGARLVPGREWALALIYAGMTACLALPLCYLLLVEKVTVPASLPQFALIELALRLGGFWLGAIWIRQWHGPGTTRTTRVKIR